MGKLFKGICMAAALTVGPAASHAALVSVGGVTWDPDYGLDLTAGTTLSESVTNIAGDTISGYGEISALNNFSQSEFCPGDCELTFVFGGYTLIDLYDDNGDGTGYGDGTLGIDPANGLFAFSGGWLEVYVDRNGGEDFDLLDPASATNGDLWLRLEAVVDPTSTFAALGATLEGGLDSIIDINGTGNGYLNVVEGVGLAWENFNTDNANFRCDLSGGTFCPDLFFESTFDYDPRLAAATNGEFTHVGSADMSGFTIPEPSTIALFGLSLVSLGLVRRRMKA
ncbi:MAG: PEP-CTERM sorting domain-containing protein [Sedimenticola sp.]